MQSIFKKYWLLIIAIVFVLILAIPYLLGYRLGPGLKIEQDGTLVIAGLPKGASVYVDESLRGVTSKPGSMKDTVAEGSHSIIVSVTGDYPWSTIALVTSGKTSTVNPILVGMTPDATPLSGADKAAAISAIASSSLPSITHPLVLANNCAIVYVSNNQVIASAATSTPGCSTPPPYLCDTDGSCAPTIIFSPIATLSAVEKYPGRQDAILVEFNNTLYALALDPRSPQFFAPVLTGTAPIIGALPDGTIVVRNGTAVYSVKL